MLYLQATATGAACALLFGLASLGVPIAAAWVIFFLGSRMGSGSGGIGAISVGSEWTLLAAIIGFAGGFYWTLHRARRRQLSN
jgi:hypothetical protein